MKQAVLLGVLAVVNIGVAFMFQWFVLTQLGPGIETDALFAGMTLPQLVLAVISGSLMHVLVPLLAGENEDQLCRDSWAFTFLVGGLFGLLAFVLYITASWWIPITVPGFSDEAKQLTVLLTRIQLIGMVFTAINGVQWAAYHARQKFIWAEFAPVVSGAISMALLVWLLPVYGVEAAAWLSTLRIGIQTLLLLPGVGRSSWPDLKSPAVKTTWRNIKPLLLGTTYYKTDTLIDRVLLSTANSGSLSLYYLAQQIYSAASQVINKAITAPLVPKLSKFYKAGDKASFQRTYYHNLSLTGGLGILALLLLGTIGQKLLNLLIGYGSVSVANVIELWWIMIGLGGMFWGGIVGQISSSSFYSLGDTSTPTRLGAYSYTLYIPIKICFYYYFGVMGLALATSLFLLINFLLQNKILNTKYF